MNRKPPAAVLKHLRREVGFGCPVDGCGSPYLEWHHFDPPWHEKNHHDPEGMIALCTEHHPIADGGAYTIAQLRAFKQNVAQAERVKGQFHWLRNRLLAVVGGNYFYETNRILVIDGVDVVAFSRDEEGYLRLNVRMLSLLAEDRAVIEDSMWTNIGKPSDLRSPPLGKELQIEYANGDFLHVKFLELESAQAAFEKYGHEALLNADFIEFPVTTVELNYRIGGTKLELTPKGSSFFGGQMIGSFSAYNAVGVRLDGTGHKFRQNPSELTNTKIPRIASCPCGSGKRFKHCHGFLGV